MTAALSAEQRTSLERLIQNARRWIEEDLEQALEGKYGINMDGQIEPLVSLSLSNAGSAVRADLVEIVEYLRSEGETAEASVIRLVREAAFTHTNRLIAVRVAEAIGLLPETMAKGLASTGFRDFTELAPAVASSEWGRYAEFIRLCADELASDVPALFDPRNPLIGLKMSERVFTKVVDSIVDLDGGIWGAPDTLGWAYQFFNTGEERKEMRDASAAPRTSRELAVRNQFFTPSYVVEFLVHNGLGAHLAAGFPGLADELPMLVEVPTEQIDVDLESVSVLDPAVGSGHFLLGAYDVLEKAWQHAGVEPADAAPAIVRSLWGIDIDPRATQIAQAAVMFRARRHCRDEELPVANVICARSLPTGPEVDALVDALPEHVGRVVSVIAEELVDAPILGPLLKIEERLSHEVKDVFGTGVIEGTLSEGAEVDNIETAVLHALADIADSAISSAAQRLFAAEAHDAVRFVEAMSRRYTAVLMNPPFGEPVPDTKPYLKAAYPWIPTKDYNLFAAFVGRGLELTEEKTGTCAAITSRSGLFLKTYEKWRQEILLGNYLTALADLGYGVMEQALVEAAAYVITNRETTGTGTFIRLLKETDRAAALTETIQEHRSGNDDRRVFVIKLTDLHAIPGSPVAYWMSSSIRRLFRDLPPLEGNGAEARQGLATGDDFRFIRAFWEIDPERIGYSVQETITGKEWAPFAKGGEYSPYWADIHLLVNWKDGGKYLKAFEGSVIRNPQHYFEIGLTWPPRTNSGFGVRLLPSGCVFANKGNGIFSECDLHSVLGWLNSRLVQAMIDAMVAAGEEASSGGASRSYEVGLVKKLPWREVAEIVEPIARLTQRRVYCDYSDETTRHFVTFSYSAFDSLNELLVQLDDGGIVDALVIEAADLDCDGTAYLDEEVGRYPLSYPESNKYDDRIENLYSRPIKEVIDELIQERGGSRAIANLTFVADRRLEVIAHGLEINPRSIVRVVRERGLVAPGALAKEAERLLSYLVGVAFGRWDVRIGCDPSIAEVPSDLLSPPARYSPGMLLGANGVPPVVAPGGYPIGLPPDGLLVDEPGHSWDVEQRVADSAVALFGSEEPMGDALAELMKRPSLGGYLRSEFFKDHLGRYSMSRRKAPIYWQLQVPLKTWGIWLYAPRLSREMLFAVVRETEQRQRLAEQQIGHLQREAETGGGGRKASEVAKELEVEQKLAVELKSFRAEAERIANLGWEPDLDDGMVLNAAPLADLFPAWKDAAKYRKELRAGKHEWATVAQFADQL
jgi:hypothetical protein